MVAGIVGACCAYHTSHRMLEESDAGLTWCPTMRQGTVTGLQDEAYGLLPYVLTPATGVGIVLGP